MDQFVVDIMNYYIQLKMIGHQIGGRVFRISISNRKDAPWLNLIQKGKKRYEGRLRKGIWNEMKVGDSIIFYNDNQEVATTIVSLTEYDDFEEAFHELGEAFIPIKGITEKEVNELISRYYSDDMIRKYGVVAVGIKVT